jgi:hypothetical protein
MLHRDWEDNMKQIYYSASTLGFSFVATEPDSVEITHEEHQRLLNSQVDGFKIVAGEDGRPELVAQDQPTAAELASLELRSRRLEADRSVSLLQPAVEAGYAKPEHTQLLADWQRYRYELTSVPEQPGWPESPQWPDQPEAII